MARTIIPFGPQHPVLPEPIQLRLVMENEKIVEALEGWAQLVLLYLQPSLVIHGVVQDQDQLP